MPQAIAVPVRQAILARHEQGQSTTTIADELQLSARTVRHLLARFRQGPDALRPSYRSPPRAPHPLLDTVLDYRRRHPAWGAELIRAHLRRDRPGLAVPCARTLQRWLLRAGLSPAPSGRKALPRRRRAEAPHEVLQMDAAEQIGLKGGLQASWLRLVDECSGAFLRTRVFPLGQWNLVPVACVQGQLRDTFAAWGLPLLLRVDNGHPWGSKGDLPTDLALWLIGLGIELWWNNPRRPQENGVVERSQGTGKSWGEPHTCVSACELQRRIDDLDELQRCYYPYEGERSRMECYPGLAHSGRAYEPGREAAVWQWQRVADHLGGYCVPRKVDQKGQVSIYNRNHYVGTRWCGQPLWVTFNGAACQWVVADEHGQILKEILAEELRADRILALEVTHRR